MRRRVRTGSWIRSVERATSRRGSPSARLRITSSGSRSQVPRCRDGKIVEEWDVWDALGALQQVGGLPE